MLFELFTKLMDISKVSKTIEHTHTWRHFTEDSDKVVTGRCRACKGCKLLEQQRYVNSLEDDTEKFGSRYGDRSMTHYDWWEDERARQWSSDIS